MKVPEKLQLLGKVISAIKAHGHAVSRLIAEEMEYKPAIFDVQGTAEPVRDEDDFTPLPIIPEGPTINFQAFIDGVQRTTPVYWVSLEKLGTQVPVHVGHIAVGVVLRDNTGKLRCKFDFIKDRLLILMPLTGMERAGFEGTSLLRELIDEGNLIPDSQVAEDPISAFNIEKEVGPIVLCDTTFSGLEESMREDDLKELDRNPERVKKGAGALLVDELLYNTGRVRSRAQGRVNTIRQILEMLVVTKFREVYGREIYVLVDGPLFFMGKWLRKHDVLGGLREVEREKFVLKNAVGLVKSLRGRPKEMMHLRNILCMAEGERSPLMKIADAVDIGSSETFVKPHMTTYLRLRSPPEGLSLPSPVGIVRVDLHVSTIGCDNTDQVKCMSKEEEEALLGPIVRGIRRERWPSVTDKGRMFTQVFPISETERMLHARLYSSRELAYIYSIFRT